MLGTEIRRNYNKAFKGLKRHGRYGAGSILAVYLLQIPAAGLIAAALLERSGAGLDFANGADPYQTLTDQPDRRGAIVRLARAGKRPAVPANLAAAETLDADR